MDDDDNADDHYDDDDDDDDHYDDDDVVDDDFDLTGIKENDGNEDPPDGNPPFAPSVGPVV